STLELKEAPGMTDSADESEYQEDSESEELSDEGSDEADSEPDDDELETLKKLMSVNDKSFEDLELPPKVVKSTQKAWETFVSVFERREGAADSLYGAFFDAAPNLQGMFRA
ncbi:unnamed protein product, partial [Cladocopium goreaui]